MDGHNASFHDRGCGETTRPSCSTCARWFRSRLTQCCLTCTRRTGRSIAVGLPNRLWQRSAHDCLKMKLWQISAVIVSQRARFYQVIRRIRMVAPLRYQCTPVHTAPSNRCLYRLQRRPSSVDTPLVSHCGRLPQSGPAASRVRSGCRLLSSARSAPLVASGTVPKDLTKKLIGRKCYKKRAAHNFIHVRRKLAVTMFHLAFI